MPDKTTEINQSIDSEAKAMGLDPSELEGEADMSDGSTNPIDPTPSLGGNEEPKGEPDPKPNPQPKEEEEAEEDPPPKKDEEQGGKSGEGDKGKKPKTPPDPKTHVPIEEFAFKEREWKREMKVLQDKLDLAQKNDDPKKQEQVEQEIAKKAQEHWKDIVDKYPNTSPEALEAIFGAMKNRLAKELGITPERVEALGKVTEKLPVIDKVISDADKQEQLTQFNTEWGNVLPDLQKQYPNATPEQIQKAKDLMDELSHNKTYGTTDQHPAYELPYILFKEAEQFKGILFSPKKKTAESSHLGEQGDVEPQSMGWEYEDLNPKNVEKAEEDVAKAFGGK